MKFGLGRRASLPTDALVKYAGSDFASVREDMAWLMARQVLVGHRVASRRAAQRAKSLVAAATSTATKWAKSVGTDKVAEESAFLRLLWAATLHASARRGGAGREVALGWHPRAGERAGRGGSRAARKRGAGAAPVLTSGASDIDGGVRRASVSALVGSGAGAGARRSSRAASRSTRSPSTR